MLINAENVKWGGNPLIRRVLTVFGYEGTVLIGCRSGIGINLEKAEQSTVLLCTMKVECSLLLINKHYLSGRMHSAIS